MESPEQKLQAEVALLRRQLAREVRSREQAERLAEEGTRDLFDRQSALALLATVAGAANSEARLADSLAVVLKALAEYGQWEIGHAYGCPPGRDELRPMGQWYERGGQNFAVFKAASERLSFSTGVGLPGRTLASGSPILSADLASDATFLRRDEAAACGLASGFAFPVRTSIGGRAVLEFYSIRRVAEEVYLAPLMAQITAQLAPIFSRHWVELERSRTQRELERTVQERTELLSAKVRELDLSMSSLRQMQQSLLVQNRALSAAGNGIVITDAVAPNNPIIYNNPAFELLTGYTADELRGRNCRMLQGADTDPATVETVREAIRRGEGCHVVIKNYRRDGTPFWNQLTISPVRDAEEVVTHFVGIQDDVSAQQETAHNLRVSKEAGEAANLELARAARLKDEFLAAMSHELRTPLNAVLGMTQLLTGQYSGPLNEEQLSMVKLIDESGQHLMALINDILDLSKIEAGKAVLNLEHVKVEDTANASVRMVLEQAFKKQIGVSCTVDTDISTLWADQRRLKQILVNLLNNAVKFTAEGGKVSLQVSPSCDGAGVAFKVSDTGIGIAAADLERLFQPFEQIDSTLARKFEGTGLGLALVRRMVQMHGGAVSVESQLGQGSQFTVVIPYAKDQAQLVEKVSASSEGPPKAPALAKRALRVVLAEDNAANQEVVRRYLESLGHSVTLALEGDEAFRRVVALRPDVVLMDVQMPGTDGLESIRMIRSVRSVAKVPIVALTALAMPGDRRRCLDAGADYYMSKPVSLRELGVLLDQIGAKK